MRIMIIDKKTRYYLFFRSVNEEVLEDTIMNVLMTKPQDLLNQRIIKKNKNKLEMEIIIILLQ